MLHNPRGTAPGLWLETNGRIVFCSPACRTNCRRCLNRSAASASAHAHEAPAVSRAICASTGLPESDAEMRVGALYPLYADTETTILAAPGEFSSILACGLTIPNTAEKMLDDMVERIGLALGEHLFSTRGNDSRKWSRAC